MFTFKWICQIKKSVGLRQPSSLMGLSRPKQFEFESMLGWWFFVYACVDTAAIHHREFSERLHYFQENFPILELFRWVIRLKTAITTFDGNLKLTSEDPGWLTLTGSATYIIWNNRPNGLMRITRINICTFCFYKTKRRLLRESGRSVPLRVNKLVKIRQILAFCVT